MLDLDGTLTDPRVGMFACFKHAFAGLGEQCPADADLLRWIGPPLHRSFGAVFGHGTPRTAAAIALYRERFTATGMFENEVYPGIPEALAALDRLGATLVVATSKVGVYAERIIEHFGLGQYVRAVYGSELDGTRSDKSELISYVLRTHGMRVADTYMVGDREYDMIGAAANGVTGIGALWGYGSRQELIAAGASRLCERPTELEHAFQLKRE